MFSSTSSSRYACSFRVQLALEALATEQIHQANGGIPQAAHDDTSGDPATPDSPIDIDKSSRLLRRSRQQHRGQREYQRVERADPVEEEGQTAPNSYRAT